MFIWELEGWLSGKESTWRCGFHPWREKIPCRMRWQPTPVFLPGKSRRQRSLEGLVPGVTKSQAQLKQLTTCGGRLSGWVENQQEEVQEGRGGREGGTRLGVSCLASNLQCDLGKAS